MIIDYVTATFDLGQECDYSQLVHALDPKAVELENGQGFILLGSGRWTWGSAERKLPHRLSLGGKALALLRELDWTPFKLFCRVWDLGGRLTRVDYAWDFEREASPFIEQVCREIEQGNYTSRWRLTSGRSCYRTAAVVGAGDTLRLGSPTSDFLMRIYDKQAEADLEMPRLRFEFVTRKERAEALARGWHFAEWQADYIKAHVFAYLDFKEPTEDSNKTRWPTAPWWEEIFGQEKKRITLSTDAPDEQKTRQWVEKIAPTIALITDITSGTEGEVSYLHQLYKDGHRRYLESPTHKAKKRAWEAVRSCAH